jgi:hypothetical protein
VAFIGAVFHHKRKAIGFGVPLIGEGAGLHCN